MADQGNAIEALKWQLAAGADEAISESPRNWLAPPKQPASAAPAVTAQTIDAILNGNRSDMPPRKETPLTPRPALALTPPSEAMAEARRLADAAQDIETLKASVLAFDKIALKATATQAVFSEGPADAPLVVVGEAPGENEDKQGRPFCGVSGKLLDNMLASIGMGRDRNVYITNSVFWRPPGNRTPSQEELDICRPFVEKHLALLKPRLILLAGASAARSLLEETQGISRLRGRKFDYSNQYLSAPLPVMLTYHPSYLLRQPGQKAMAWQDMLAIKRFLNEAGA